MVLLQGLKHLAQHQDPVVLLQGLKHLVQHQDLVDLLQGLNKLLVQHQGPVDHQGLSYLDHQDPVVHNGLRLRLLHQDLRPLLLDHHHDLNLQDRQFLQSQQQAKEVAGCLKQPQFLEYCDNHLLLGSLQNLKGNQQIIPRSKYY